MGKRKKSSKKPVTKAIVPRLDTTFDCPFCHQLKSVSVTMQRSSVPMRGVLSCVTCGARYQCEIHALSEPVDVFSEWMDAIEEVNTVREER
ncbi:hypothetical protein CDCA_CDCA03G0838 [Cyanidium caldarium]|uniref:Transcription elongation factor 1 homolog n=1 Tax=Cyanidium caldarium TaxID=2771 RepID=A0AAV9ISE3_CYACA|nr:hypothetical protein CDCA_CDCA03G0838 [Cyanidium caldarium]